jgi:arylsulfatase A-like enzyme
MPSKKNSESKSPGRTNNQTAKELPNIVILLTDQERTTDLWMPKSFANSKEQLPAQNYLKDNGLSFSNAFTNTNMCSSARATFFTGKFPAQHGVRNLLSDVNNPVINDQVQLNPDLPNLATYLVDAGYDADNLFYKGKWHISKSVIRTMGTADSSDDEEVYIDMKDYGFQQWEGPDAGGTGSTPARRTNSNPNTGQPFRISRWI